MNYDEAIAYLYASRPAFHLVGAAAYKPGLENTYRLMQHIGNPHKRLRCVHIAGTNGKGSTSHMIAAALQAAGLRVGLYTSPHLIDFRERIRINGQCIGETDVAEFISQNQSFLDEVQPSFFETTMAMAFDYFARQNVDIAVIEVGLGGRLDSTNVITPILSVITNIGMDHTEFLGTTLAEIANEKAGIIKCGVPCIIGETQSETESVFVAKAKSTNSPILFADQQPANSIVNCELIGIYQQHNIQTAYVALRTLGIDDDAICYGMANVCRMTGLRGRWETIATKPLTICDTGHNSHGLRYVALQLQLWQDAHPRNQLHIVFGMVNDKDVMVVLDLLPITATYYFTQAKTHRAIPAEQLQQMATRGTAYSSVAEAIHAAQKNAAVDDMIFIGGSNYVVGEALSLFELR